VARALPYTLAVLGVALTAGLVALLRTQFDLPTAVLLYLVPIIFAAARWGRWPAALAAIVAALAHDYFFIPPIGTLTVAKPDEAVGLVLLVFTALATAELADAARRSAQHERAAQLAQQADEMKTALLHAVTHDLRTPLASIKANVSGLRQSDVAYTAEDRAELLEVIDDEADRLDRLLGNLLDASRLEAGVLVPHKQPQDLAELIRTVLARMATLLGERSVRFDVQPDMPLVRCDYGQIDQLVTNLIENAARHTPSGSPVEIRLTADDNSAHLHVVDRGPGIASEDRARIFRPFERGHTAAPGSGLGLSIARGMAEAHGGRLEVQQAAGDGAHFALTLPL
jgi:two-component system, OmpR family, sensor histidine kinase KdpD